MKIVSWGLTATCHFIGTKFKQFMHKNSFLVELMKVYK